MDGQGHGRGIVGMGDVDDSFRSDVLWSGGEGVTDYCRWDLAGLLGSGL